MAIDPLTIATIGSSILGGILGNNASRRAADAQQQANQMAIGEQRRQFNNIMQILAPAISTGNNARTEVANLLGISPGDPNSVLGGLQWGSALGLGLPQAGNNFANTNTGGGTTPPGVTFMAPKASVPTSTAGEFPGGFFAPGTQFIADQARRAVEASAAARGGLISGGTLAGIADRTANVAAMDFGNHINRLLALASGGQAATQNAAQTGLATGNAVSGLLSNSGTAQAAGIMGGANSIGNSLNNLGGNLAFLNLFGGGTNPGNNPMGTGGLLG